MQNEGADNTQNKHRLLKFDEDIDDPDYNPDDLCEGTTKFQTINFTRMQTLHSKIQDQEEKIPISISDMNCP